MSSFYMPVRVYEETDCVLNHPEVFTAAGTKALIVTGRHSAKTNGSLEDVLSVLKKNGIAHALFDGVEENPSIETIMRAREFGLSENTDFVIGIGGGSPLDAAKAAAMMIFRKDEDASYLYGSKTTERQPLILIPTTCGTGSEVTGVSVLTIHEKKTKSSIPHKLFGDAALIDGKYLAAAPLQVIRNTAVDALGHLIESYINADADDYSRMCADAGLRTYSRVRDLLLKTEGLDGPAEASGLFTAENYADLMKASTLAGMAIAQDGTSLPHALSYPVTYAMHMAHGKAIGYFMAGYLNEADENDRTHVLRTAGFKDLSDFKSFYAAMCGTEKLPEEMLVKVTESLLSNPSKLAKAPFPCDRAVIERIVRY